MKEYLIQLTTLLDNYWVEVTVFSIGIFAASLLALPIMIARLPEDFFLQPDPERQRITLSSSLLFIVRNLLGGLILLLGIVMLVLPGQGLLTIASALTIMKFPGKRQLELWLLKAQPLAHALNWIRRKEGKPPFRFPS